MAHVAFGYGYCLNLYDKEDYRNTSGSDELAGKPLSDKLIGYKLVISTEPKRGYQNGRYYAGVFDGRVERDGEFYIRLKSCHTLHPRWDGTTRFAFYPVARIKWKEKKARDEALTEFFTIPLRTCLFFPCMSPPDDGWKLKDVMDMFLVQNYTIDKKIFQDLNVEPT